MGTGHRGEGSESGGGWEYRSFQCLEDSWKTLSFSDWCLFHPRLGPVVSATTFLRGEGYPRPGVGPKART